MVPGAFAQVFQPGIEPVPLHVAVIHGFEQVREPVELAHQLDAEAAAGAGDLPQDRRAV